MGQNPVSSIINRSGGNASSIMMMILLTRYNLGIFVVVAHVLTFNVCVYVIYFLRTKTSSVTNTPLGLLMFNYDLSLYLFYTYMIYNFSTYYITSLSQFIKYY